MGNSVDPETGESIGDSAMAELGHPAEQSERSGWAAPVPSPEKYTYFYVPATSGDTADALAGDAFGALLRLGSYSDIEEAAGDIRPQADHYPRHHLRDEGGAEAALSQASGGRQGILLACDGRFLIRSNEKMYVDTGDYDQYSSGDYDLEVDGTMRLATTGSDGGITISSDQDTLTLESGPDQNITLSAGDGTGNITRRVKTSTTVISGNEYTFTRVGRLRSAQGTQMTGFAGLTVTTTGAANLYVNGGVDLFIRFSHILLSFNEMECAFVRTHYVGLYFLLKQYVLVNSELEKMSAKNAVKKNDIAVSNDNINNRNYRFSSRNQRMNSESSNIKSSLGKSKFRNNDINTSN